MSIACVLACISWLENRHVLCWIYICHAEERRPPLWSSGQSSWLLKGDVLCFLWGTNWIYICYVKESRRLLWSSGQSSWLHNGDVFCFLWGTNWIYTCHAEESRPPLWSSGQSSWLHNGDVLCFLWGTNWIYISYIEAIRPPLLSSGQSSWLQIGDVLCFLWGTNWMYVCYVEESRVHAYRSRGPGSIPGATRFFWEVVGLERGPLSLGSRIEELLGIKLAAPVLETENTAVGIRHAEHAARSIRKCSTNFADKRWSPGRYSSLADWVGYLNNGRLEISYIFFEETVTYCCCPVQVAAHPRNNLTLGATYLTVERFDEGSDNWRIVATDANWETRYGLCCASRLDIKILS
jgi:hypothetical protein